MPSNRIGPIRSDDRQLSSLSLVVRSYIGEGHGQRPKHPSPKGPALGGGKHAARLRFSSCVSVRTGVSDRGTNCTAGNILRRSEFERPCTSETKSAVRNIRDEVRQRCYQCEPMPSHSADWERHERGSRARQTPDRPYGVGPPARRWRRGQQQGVVAQEENDDHEIQQSHTHQYLRPSQFTAFCPTPLHPTKGRKRVSPF
jgi:hypothetical protein